MDEATPRDIFGAASDTINRYVDILANRGIDWGLIGPREADRLWDRHILNSVALAPLIPSGASVVDVGSGAGLPGIPLAVLRTDLQVVLLEPLLRRFNFLTLAVDELGLTGRVRVVRGRAEDYKDRHDVVTCRAVAPLPRLLDWCLPLVARDGCLVALKGSTAAEEVASASADLRRHRAEARVEQLSVPGTAESTWAIVVQPTRR